MSRSVCIHSDSSARFPVHTHGLGIAGLPEFIFESPAVVPEQGGLIMAKVIDMAIANKELGHMIIDGQDVVFDGVVVGIDGRPKRLYSRHVSGAFTGVQSAYGNVEIKPSRVLQLYVEGEDFVLNEPYFQVPRIPIREFECACCGQPTLN
ncbi:MAG: hypothetical protein ABIL58_00955 [Pseudomonadota bacterium]